MPYSSDAAGLVIDGVRVPFDQLGYLCHLAAEYRSVGTCYRLFRARFIDARRVTPTIVRAFLRGLWRAERVQIQDTLVARAAAPSGRRFAAHVGPDNRIDWDTVPGYVDHRSEMLAAAAAARRPTARDDRNGLPREAGRAASGGAWISDREIAAFRAALPAAASIERMSHGRSVTEPAHRDRAALGRESFASSTSARAAA